jgi:hypothetical protein
MARSHSSFTRLPRRSTAIEPFRGSRQPTTIDGIVTPVSRRDSSRPSIDGGASCRPSSMRRKPIPTAAKI